MAKTLKFLFPKCAGSMAGSLYYYIHNRKRNKNLPTVIDTENLYDEEKFVAEKACKKDNSISFAENGKLLFGKIIYPKSVEKVNNIYNIELKNTIEFFKNTLYKMTGDVFGDGSGEIQLLLDESENFSGGYKLIIDNTIKIISNDLQGLTFGIYSFLEDELGCMFVSKDFDYIPKMKTVYLEKKNKTDIPGVKWRNIYSHDVMCFKDSARKNDYLGYHSKLRLNGMAEGGGWYNWVHSSFTYVPPEKYFKEHPEYFSEFEGKRCYKQGPVSGQLCYTNEDVYKIISEQVFKQMAENPDKYVWDISQMDTWINRGAGCQCEKCREINDKEGSEIGSILAFINRLADECKERFPNNFISTLAYNYSVKPPKFMKPRDNVIIKLCLMPGDNSCLLKKPESAPSKTAHDVVKQWGKIAKHILIWDYNVNFSNYFMPFPSIYGMGENHKFYIRNNTYGIFHQMDYDKGGVDSELHTYLFAKSMWNPAEDIARLASKYLTVYYGKSSPFMAEYYQSLSDNVQKSPLPLYIYDSADEAGFGYLSKRNLRGYFKLFAEAEKAAEDDKIVLARVRKAKIGILYTRAEQFSFKRKDRRKALKELAEICGENGIDVFREAGDNKLGYFIAETEERIKATPLLYPLMITGVLPISAIAGCIGMWITERKNRIK